MKRKCKGRYAPVRVSIDENTSAVVHDGEKAYLTEMEFAIMKALAMNGGGLLDRETILDSAGIAGGANARRVDSHVKGIRHKLDAVRPGLGALVQTVPKRGYRVDAELFEIEFVSAKSTMSATGPSELAIHPISANDIGRCLDAELASKVLSEKAEGELLQRAKIALIRDISDNDMAGSALRTAADEMAAERGWDVRP